MDDHTFIITISILGFLFVIGIGMAIFAASYQAYLNERKGK